MKLCRPWAAALALLLAAQTHLVAQTSGSNLLSSAGSQSESSQDVTLAGFQSLAVGGGPATQLPMINRNCGQFFVGGEYLHIRALPSEAIAYQAFDVTGQAPVDTLVQFEFDHEANYRVYGGYRLNNCGEEIRFSFMSIGSGATSDTGPVDAGSNITFFSPVEVPADDPGERLTANANVSLRSYDLGWSKTIPLGCPMTCCDDACCGDTCGGDCGSCCDPCGACCWCPAWDITFSAGLRVADFDASRTYQAFNASNALQRTAINDIEFQGVGGRFGMMGRRYIGKSGTASLFLKGDVSLLVGDVELVNRTFSGAGALLSTQQIGCTHIIPVTEIEAGGTVFLTCNTSLSAGYMLAAWHDLGLREDYRFNALPTYYDDANIMGFDGFFARIETNF